MMLATPHGRLAQRLALGVPAIMLAGAYIAQYVFGLFPCEMCWWQRWPHFAAFALALLSTFAPPRRAWIALAAVAILVSGAIGAFHAGVEYGWWEGITGCAVTTQGGDDPLEAIMNAPVVRCDSAPWDLFSISLAGWNFLLSFAGGLAILGLLARERRA